MIEVLVAVTLLAVIAILLWQSMGSAIKSKERFEAEDEAFRNAALAMDRISRDLKMSFLFSKPDLLGVSPSGEQMSKDVFIGADQGELDKLTFVTFAHLRYLKNTKESDAAEVSYFVEKGPGFEGEGDVDILKKREASPPDAQPEEGGNVSNILENVKEFNVRYYDMDKDEYTDAWDSTSVDHLNKLPRAVEVTLGVVNPVDEDQVLKFKTVVFLEMAPGPNDY